MTQNAQRISWDDEILMERMNKDHIWFNLGDMTFNLYAVGGRLIWQPENCDWYELDKDD